MIRSTSELTRAAASITSRIRSASCAPKFTIRVAVPKLGEATAEGSSKQEAETAAAAALLSELQ
jgi:dsRNA-specific ribonuclease